MTNKSLSFAKRVGVLVLLELAIVVLAGLFSCFTCGHQIIIENQITLPKIEIWVATVTGYSSTVDQTDSSPFITASGKRVHEGIIACPRELTFGTQVKIQGRIFICEDRMNKKSNDRFDIWFASRSEARAWGKQFLTVEILQ